MRRRLRLVLIVIVSLAFLGIAVPAQAIPPKTDSFSDSGTRIVIDWATDEMIFEAGVHPGFDGIDWCSMLAGTP